MSAAAAGPLDGVFAALDVAARREMAAFLRPLPGQ